MYTDGLNFRQIGRHLKVSHTTVMEWIKEHVEKLPEAPCGGPIELDTFLVFFRGNPLHSCLEGKHQTQWY